MSGATILENLTGGYYQVKTDQGLEYWEGKKRKAERDLEQSNLQIEKIDEEKTAELFKLNSLKLDRDLEIAVYQVVVDDPDATKADQDAARKKLQDANDAYREQKVRVEYLEDIRGKWQLTGIDAQKRLDECELYPPEQIRYMWSADGYADHAEGDVVRVLDLFIEGQLEQGQVTYQSVIAPLSDDEAEWFDPSYSETRKPYNKKVDGYRCDQHLLSTAAWAYNVTIMPAVQQRAPVYRAGVVIDKTPDGLEVEHFKVYSSASLKNRLSADPYDDEIVIKKYQARYGNRHLGAFGIGDRVVIKMFDGYDDPRNLVIGFVENPVDPWATRAIGPVFQTELENNASYTVNTQYPWIMQTRHNYAEMIRQGRRVDVIWNGPDEEGNSTDEWRQSERFYSWPAYWYQEEVFVPASSRGPEDSVFFWTSATGGGVNGVDSYHFAFYEYAGLLPFSGGGGFFNELANTEPPLGPMNICWIDNDVKDGWYGKTDGEPGETRWLNHPIQAAIYVDGMHVETIAKIQCTSYYPYQFQYKVPDAYSKKVWPGWPNDPIYSPAFQERDFSRFEGETGFAYWQALSGVHHTEDDYNRVPNTGWTTVVYPYEGPNLIEKRIEGYKMKLPPLVGPIWPFAPPPYATDPVYPDPWEIRETYRAG